MEVSFNVPGAGPLTQIGLHILSFDTAVHLATGAVGWWKAKERSQSLAQSLSARNASLVSTSAFDSASYRVRRNVGTVQGLGVQEGVLRRFPNGIESTAVSQDPGTDCLRALATGLMCFCSVQLTTTILADIVPFGLLQGDQDDKLPTFDGPLHASLRDWVSAVAAEEDCNTFRNHLLRRVSELRNQATKSYRILPPPEDEYEELPLLLGFLRWMVTPRHKRALNKYPTRSLRVWVAAAIMSELAFSVSVSLATIYSKEEYIKIMSTSDPTDHYPDVVLVTASVGDADPWVLSECAAASLDVRPQVFPILGIPYAAFGALWKQHSRVDAEQLVEIWKVAYTYARDAVQLPTLSRGGMVHLKPVSKDTQVLRDNHKLLLGPWSPHLPLILRRAMDDYLPTILDDNWAPDAIKGFFHRRANGEMMALENEELINNAYRLSAIILGTIYGACSKALIPVATGHDQNPGSDFLEVAFSPDSVLSSKVFNWTSALGRALGGFLELSGWTGLLLEIVTGIEHPQPLQMESPSLMTQNIQVTDVAQKQHVRMGDVFGAQANGVFAISDFLVRPPGHANNALLFHVRTDRILNFPVDENGYLRASRVTTPVSDLHLDPDPELVVLSRQALGTTTPEIRIDAEPDWASNAQTISFTVRNSGTVVARVNVMHLLERLMSYTVACQCTEPVAEVPVQRSERWQVVPMYQLFQNPRRSSKHGVSIPDQYRIIIGVGDDPTSRASVVGTLSCRRMVICECIYCAYAKLQKRAAVGSVALIIG